MNTGPSENKDTTSAYDLVPFTFYANKQETSIWELLDTGAMKNFIGTRIAIMVFAVRTQELVLMANGLTLPTSELTNPANIYVVDLNFNLQLATLEDLSFPVVLDFPWWNSTQCNIEWANMSVVMHQKKVTSAVSLSN